VTERLEFIVFISYGIVVQSFGSGGITAAINRVEARNNGDSGVFLSGSSASGGSITAVVTDSGATGNSTGYSVNSSGVPNLLTVAVSGRQDHRDFFTGRSRNRPARGIDHNGQNRGGLADPGWDDQDLRRQ